MMLNTLFDGLAVVPVLVGPLQALLAVLPGLLIAAGLGIVALFKPSGLKRLARLLWQLKVPLVVMAAAITAAVMAWPQAAAPSLPVAAAEAGSDQPMFRGGPQRLGAAPGAEGPVRGGVRWRYQGEGGFYSSPTLVGNRIYATTAKTSAFDPKGGSGRIICLDADSGSELWSIAPDGYAPTFSSPAVSGNHLVVGEGLHLTKDARVVCVDIGGEQPRIRWTFHTKSHVESTPCIVGDRVIVGAGDDGYYCLALEPDAQGQAVVLWHREGSRYPDAETSPVAADGLVFVGLGLGGNAVCALDVETGEVPITNLPVGLT